MSAQPNEKTAGRDDLGRFSVGNSGGPGNTSARRAAQLRRLLLGSVSDEDARAIMRQLVEMAKEGNLAAIKLVFQYTIGKPAPVSDLDWEETETRTREEYGASEASGGRKPPVATPEQGTHVPRSPSTPDLMRQIEDAIKLQQSPINLGPKTLATAASGRR